MQKKETFSIPIQITFDLTKHAPETSGLMSSLRQMGFYQESVGGTITRATYTGTFTGTEESLLELGRAVKAVEGHGSEK